MSHSNFCSRTGHHVKALLRAYLHRSGHVQVTCLLECQKEALWRSLHLKRRGCRRRLHFSQDEQAHLSKMSSSSIPISKCQHYQMQSGEMTWQSICKSMFFLQIRSHQCKFFVLTADATDTLFAK